MLWQKLIGAKSSASKIEYVGGTTASNGPTSNESYSVSLTSLTGGIGTAPIEGDIVVICSGWVGTTFSAYQIYDATWTLAFNAAAYDNRNANFAVIYKVMTSTPDTSFLADSIPNSSRGKVTAVHVWRNVNETNPLDVSITTAFGINAARPNSPSITPATQGCVVLSLGLGTGATDVLPFTAPSGMTNSVTVARGVSGYGASCGIASYSEWISGAYDPAAWTGGYTSTSDSWYAATLVLRPK